MVVVFRHYVISVPYFVPTQFVKEYVDNQSTELATNGRSAGDDNGIRWGIGSGANEFESVPSGLQYPSQTTEPIEGAGLRRLDPGPQLDHWREHYHSDPLRDGRTCEE